MIEEYDAIAARIVEKLRAADPEERARWGAEELRRAEHVRTEGVEQHLIAVGVPGRVRALLRDGLRDTRPFARVSAWLNSDDPGKWCLVLSSSKGSGKTVAAGHWLVSQAPTCPMYWDKDKKARMRLPAWWTAAQLSRLSSFGPELDAVFKHRGPIVVDDMGAEYSDRHGFMQTLVDALVDGRYSEVRPLLMTTNLNAQAFRERYGDRVADRLNEGGAFFEFKSKSMRGAS